MGKVIIVCGQTGAGKTTYSIKISKQINAIQFSIDPWMHNLYSQDMDTFNYDWMMDRIERCQIQIWETAKQILKNQGSVVLDLGFTTKKQRQQFIDKAKKLAINAEVHYINTPRNIRKQQVQKRNTEKDPSVYIFEVTEQMLDFMEPRFEPPTDKELSYGMVITTKI